MSWLLFPSSRVGHRLHRRHGGQPAQQGHQHQARGDHRAAVLPHELPQPVGPAGRGGQHRLVRQVPQDVGREAVGRLVAPRAVLLQRHHHDPVEVPLQGPLQVRRLDVAAGRDVGERIGRAHLGARFRRVDLADHPQHLQDRTPLELPGIQRRRPGQQLVEDHSQRIDVGPRVDVHQRRVGLLGRHVRGSADDRPGVGQAQVGEPLFRRLGDPEVDHLGRGPAVYLGDHHVAGLEVAVDDPLLVSVLHRLADRDEQLQAGLDRQPFAVAVFGDRLAADQLHHEERLAGLGGAAVVDAGDVGVVHQGQRLPLGVEPGQHRARVHADPDQFERHLPLDRCGLIRPVDGAHPPSPRTPSNV